MRHAFMMIGAVCLLSVSAVTSYAAATPPYKLNSAGKCIGANGQFAKTTLCKAAASAPATKCRNVKTKKFAKCGTPGTEPVSTH